jgi:uncharacterized protein (TIGR02301 family)
MIRLDHSGGTNPCIVGRIRVPREHSDMRRLSDQRRDDVDSRDYGRLGLVAATLTMLVLGAAQPLAQSTPVPRSELDGARVAGTLKPEDARPYDDKLVRLSEILGAVHYLRELCGQNDGQRWRDQMREILTADGGSALRKAMLTRSFNNGYRSFGRTYQACTPSAQTAIGRFLAEGAQLADSLVKAVP